MFCSLWLRKLQTSFRQVFGRNPVFLNRTTGAKSWIPAQKHRRNDAMGDRPSLRTNGVCSRRGHWWNTSSSDRETKTRHFLGEMGSQSAIWPSDLHHKQSWFSSSGGNSPVFQILAVAKVEVGYRKPRFLDSVLFSAPPEGYRIHSQHLGRFSER